MTKDENTKNLAYKIIEPVFYYGLNQNLKKEMSNFYNGPMVEQHAECISRTLCGLSTYIETLAPQDEFVSKCIILVNNLSNPNSDDFANYKTMRHNLVSGGFLVLAFLRAPNNLWNILPEKLKNYILNNFEDVIKLQAFDNNWMLFKSIIELFLYKNNRIDKLSYTPKSLRKFNEWYTGKNGCYNDGYHYTKDYYNSIVIHPFLLQITKTAELLGLPKLPISYTVELSRAKEHFHFINKSISDDGTYPMIGRSLSYGSGLFHLLAIMLANNEIEYDEKVINKLKKIFIKTHPDNLFNEDGWLKRDKNIMKINTIEDYIDVGGLYIRTLIFPAIL